MKLVVTMPFAMDTAELPIVSDGTDWRVALEAAVLANEAERHRSHPLTTQQFLTHLYTWLTTRW